MLGLMMPRSALNVCSKSNDVTSIPCVCVICNLLFMRAEAPLTAALHALGYLTVTLYTGLLAIDNALDAQCLLPLGFSLPTYLFSDNEHHRSLRVCRRDLRDGGKCFIQLGLR